MIHTFLASFALMASLCFAAGLCAEPGQTSSAPMRYSHHYNFGDNNHISEPNYEAEVLLLALKLTEADYGPFSLRDLNTFSASQVRAAEIMSTTPDNHYVRTFGYQEYLHEKKSLRFIAFPAYLGILSYRTCFVADVLREQLAATTDLDSLRKFSIGQGIGWSDNAILRYNGFEVNEISTNESLFKMTAINRVNLFCRGANEVLPEVREHGAMPGLVYDRSMVLYYPMPLFFYMHKNNTRELERLRVGMERAHRDGSLLDLWERHFKNNVDFVGVDKRRLFALENPELQTLKNLAEIEALFYFPVTDDHH